MRRFTVKKPVLACVCAALLGGCTWLQDWEGPQAKALPPQPPQAKLVQTADATWIDPVPVQPPVERYVPAPSETALEMGERLDRMEEQIDNMRNDMKTMMPALSRPSSIEEAVQAGAMQPASGPAITAPLPEEIPETAAKIAPIPLAVVAVEPSPDMIALAPPAAAVAMPAPLAPAVQKTAYAPAGGEAKDIHFSEDIQKTRVVVDVSAEMAFTYDVDKKSNILSIGIAGAKWSGPAGGPVEDSALISGYQAVSDGKGGTNLSVQLRKPVKVLWAQTLPSVGNKDPRIVIDISAL